MDLFPLVAFVLLCGTGSQLFPGEGLLPNPSVRWVQSAMAIGCCIAFGLMVAGGAHSLLQDPDALGAWGLGAVAWEGLSVVNAEWLGISLHHDVVGQRNRGAAVALCGVALGAAFVFGGSNIGEGDSTDVNAFSVVLGTACFVGSWALLEGATRVSLAITEEADTASGWRLGAFLLAEGLLFGRAMAGRWISAAATVGDAVRWGLPVLGLLLVAIALQRLWGPTVRRPRASVWLHGVLPAWLFVECATLLVLHFTHWRVLTS